MKNFSLQCYGRGLGLLAILLVTLIIAQGQQLTQQALPPSPTRFQPGPALPLERETAATEPLAKELKETWVLLKNGSAFSAEVEALTPNLRLRVRGLVMELKPSEVEFTANSLSELALLRFQLVSKRPFAERLAVFEWTVRHEKYHTAEFMLNELAHDPAADVQKLQAWQTRLQRLQQAQVAWQQTPVTQPVIVPATSATGMTPLQRLPEPTSAIKPATLLTIGPHSAKPPVATPASNESKLPVTAEPAKTNSTAESTASFDFFAARVQHLLIKQCATAGCHEQRGTQGFRLERSAPDEMIPRALSMRNLQQTARWLDAAQPDESPLLKNARQPHGSSRAAPLDQQEQVAYQLLRQRVWLASGKLAPAQAAPLQPAPAVTVAEPSKFGQVEPLRATFPASAAEMEPLPTTASTMPDLKAGWHAAWQRDQQMKSEEKRQQELLQQNQEQSKQEQVLQQALLRANPLGAVPPSDTPPTKVAPPPQKPVETKPAKPPIQSNKTPGVISTPNGKNPFDEDIFNKPIRR